MIVGAIPVSVIDVVSSEAGSSSIISDCGDRGRGAVLGHVVVLRLLVVGSSSCSLYLVSVLPSKVGTATIFLSCWKWWGGARWVPVAVLSTLLWR